MTPPTPTIHDESGLLSAIHELAPALGGARSLDEILRCTVEVVAEGLGLTECRIYMLDDGGRELVLRAAGGDGPIGSSHMLDPERVPIGSDIVGSVASTGRPAWSDRGRLGPGGAGVGLDGASALAVPLSSEGRLIGVIHTRDPRSGPYTEQQLQVLTTIASMAGARIETERLHRRLEGMAGEFQRAGLEMEHNAQALELARQAAEKGARAKSDLLANVSHELRTPLTSIYSLAQILRDDLGLSAQKRGEMISLVVGQCEWLASLIENLLTASKIEHGGFDCRLVPLNLVPLVEGCIRKLAPLGVGERITLEPHLGPDLPLVLADEIRIQQVLINLIHNALKFSPAGGVVGVAAHRSPHRMGRRPDGRPYIGRQAPGEDREGDFLVVVVEDTGIGIAESEHGRVFEKFVRIGDGHASGSQGTGLGVPIAAEILVAHGGALWVQSAPGRGSRFCFSLEVAG